MRRLWLLPCLLAAAGAIAQSFEEDFEGDKPWKEVEAKLPRYPKPESLLSFQVSPAIPLSYFIDAESITPGPDGVVRYSLVVRSPSGAENVTFEGMRCTTRERKLYAFGRPDNTWSRNRHALWEPITVGVRQAEHRLILYKEFFCPEKVMVSSRDEAIRALQDGMHPRAAERYRSGGDAGGD